MWFAPWTSSLPIRQGGGPPYLSTLQHCRKLKHCHSEDHTNRDSILRTSMPILPTQHPWDELTSSNKDSSPSYMPTQTPPADPSFN
ncbi:hypothetical protein ILYODFUR_034894 [Ilyodon furcidens]|uniref:Uncharacterized protein n=1 Tax=Ilyodon furcidens TaxID=33524 RepID=A0ABV0VK94_9TELE